MSGLEIALAVTILCLLIQTFRNKRKNRQIDELEEKILDLQKVFAEKEQKYNEDFTSVQRNYDEQILLMQKRLDDSIFLSETMKSNIRAIPYMAAIMADFETYGLEKLARKLDWGSSQDRLKKVKSIREIRKDAQLMVEKNKEAQYQLAYLLQLYPGLQEIIDCEFSTLPVIEVSELTEYDGCRDYLTKEEYQSLSTCEKNQLALDRYIKSAHKSKWQIGRDYELYVGYQYEKRGYKVEYPGSLYKLEDLGRDLIIHEKEQTLIVQCKYWSQEKKIHEKHINQLYGTTVCYCIENNLPKSSVVGVLVTNIELSDTAKKMADYLGIKYRENYRLGQYPRIKCNINYDEYGLKTKIYHLPFDQKYDVTKIEKPGEFMAMTVKEAEDAGFRRAFKWMGDKSLY